MSRHFYYPDGRPAYKVVGKNGQLRDATIRDARKLGLVPSVTEIMKIIPRPGLDHWKEDRLMDAVLEELTELEPEGEIDRNRIRHRAAREAMKAADIGSAIHRALEARVGHSRRPIGGLWGYHAECCYRYLINLTGITDWTPEKAFTMIDGSRGYGGRVDLLADNIIVDLKTTESHYNDNGEPKRLHWPGHKMQLVAYGVGIFKAITDMRLINLYVDYSGHVTHYEWGLSPKEIHTEYLRFWAILEAWYAINF